MTGRAGGPARTRTSTVTDEPGGPVVYSPICPSIYLSVYLPMYQCVCLSTRPPAHLFPPAYLLPPTHPILYLSVICQSAYLYIFASLYLSAGGPAPRTRAARR